MQWWDYPIGRHHDPNDNANGGELGVDLACPIGTAITTPWAAVVTYVGASASTGWIVKALTTIPGYGEIYEYFLHMTAANVAKGQHLAPGAVVGPSGGLQPGAGGWAHVEFGVFRDAKYSTQYWGFTTGSTLDPTPVITALVNGEHSMTVPNGWHDDGATLTAPNGFACVKGFRNFVLSQPWADYNWPLADEYVTDSVEPGNPSIGPGSRQNFRLGSLGWTSAKGVYQIWIGQDYQALTTQVAQLQTKIKTASAALA